MDADITKNGLEVRYNGWLNKKELSEKDKKTIDEFNEKVSVFSKIPLEWQYSKTSKNKFEKSKLEYELALAKLAELEESKSDRMTAATRIAEIDKNVWLRHFFETNADAERELKDIVSKPLWRRVVKSVAFERGGYFFMGSASRALAAGALGIIGAPIAAAATGGFIGRKRAIESLKQESLKVRGGQEQKIKKNGEALLNFAEAKNLTNKLDNLVESLETTTDKEKWQKIKDEIATRLFYTQTKMEGGLVKYGNGKEKLIFQYDLAKSMSRAQALISFHEGNINKAVQDRLDSFLEFKERKISKYVRDKMIAGAVYGAAFASLGYFARDIYHHFNISDEIKNYFGLGAKNPAIVPSRPILATPVHQVITGEKVAEKISEIKSQSAVIQKGEGIWSAAKDLVNKNLISEKQFTEAWENSHSVIKMPNGEIHHLSEIGLVHQGDEVIYVPGKNGSSAYFEILPKSRQALGTDTDLYHYYLNKNIKIPEFLKHQGKLFHQYDKEIVPPVHNVVESAQPSAQSQAMFPSGKGIELQPHQENLSGGNAAGYINHGHAMFGQKEGVELQPSSHNPTAGTGLEHTTQHPAGHDHQIISESLSHKQASPAKTLASHAHELKPTTETVKMPEGTITFGYDKLGDPSKINMDLYLAGDRGDKFFTNDWSGRLYDYAHSHNSYIEDLNTDVTHAGRTLDAYYKAYQYLKKNNLNKEANFVLGAMRNITKSLDKYGILNKTEIKQVVPDLQKD